MRLFATKVICLFLADFLLAYKMAEYLASIFGTEKDKYLLLAVVYACTLLFQIICVLIIHHGCVTFVTSF